MKKTKSQLLLIYLSIILVSCSSNSTPTPISVESEIKQILQDDTCKPPCFLGIVPEQTTVTELKNMFIRYGEPLQSVPCGYDDSNSSPDSKKLIPYMNFCVSNGKVHSMLVGIYRGDLAWSPYSPANVMKRFGTPSKIFFDILPNDYDSTKGWYRMIYSYDDLDFVIHYGFPEIKLGESITVCPNENELSDSLLWLRKDAAQKLDPRLVPLEKATSFTLESFQEYILGSGTCFNLKGEAFQNF